MRRREFLSVAAGAAALPIVARAQTAMPIIGFLHQGSADQNVERIATFRKGLAQIGLVEGQNVAIEFRWADGAFDKLPALATELVQRQVAVITTPFSTEAALAAKAATKTIPIVFLSSASPVQIGLVASLNRPGSNITGVTTLNAELAPKRLGLLREMAPNATHYFALINPDSSLAEGFIRDMAVAAAALGIRVDILRATNSPELEAAFAGIPRHSVLLCGTDFELLRTPRTDFRIGDTLRRRDDFRCPRLYQSRRVDELFRRRFGSGVADHGIYRPRPQGRKAC